ncbi:hypothetical protein ABW19_dt0210522 [Dactylella cylindrospora]|nr:hypothetical protein ABW19_dt0210522 [Dactylella cylindrospora]
MTESSTPTNSPSPRFSPRFSPDLSPPIAPRTPRASRPKREEEELRKRVVKKEMMKEREKEKEKQKQRQREVEKAVMSKVGMLEDMGRSDWDVSAQELADSFILGTELGHGAFGKVYKAYDKKNNRYVAIKMVDTDEFTDNLNEIRREITAMSACNHKNIVRHYMSFLKDTYLWIVMEFVGAGSLQDHLRVPNRLGIYERFVKIIVKEVATGLAYMHSSNVIHRDLKAANILLDTDGTVKLGDFGVSTNLSNRKSLRDSFVGTLHFVAPEVWVGAYSEAGGYDNRVDVWSLGITAIELSQGEPPYANVKHIREIGDIITRCPDIDGYLKTSVETSPHFSQEYADFLRFLLVSDPAKRPNIWQVLQHSWLQSCEPVSNILEFMRTTEFLRNKYGKPIEPDVEFERKVQEELDRQAKGEAEAPKEQTAEDDDGEKWNFDTVQSTPGIKLTPGPAYLKAKSGNKEFAPLVTKEEDGKVVVMDLGTRESFINPLDDAAFQAAARHLDKGKRVARTPTSSKTPFIGQQAQARFPLVESDDEEEGQAKLTVKRPQRSPKRQQANVSPTKQKADSKVVSGFGRQLGAAEVNSRVAGFKKELSKDQKQKQSAGQSNPDEIFGPELPPPSKHAKSVEPAEVAPSSGINGSPEKGSSDSERLKRLRRLQKRPDRPRYGPNGEKFLDLRHEVARVLYEEVAEPVIKSIMSATTRPENAEALRKLCHAWKEVYYTSAKLEVHTIKTIYTTLKKKHPEIWFLMTEEGDPKRIDMDRNGDSDVEKDPVPNCRRCDGLRDNIAELNRKNRLLTGKLEKAIGLAKELKDKVDDLSAENIAMAEMMRVEKEKAEASRKLRTAHGFRKFTAARRKEANRNVVEHNAEAGRSHERDKKQDRDDDGDDDRAEMSPPSNDGLESEPEEKPDYAPFHGRIPIPEEVSRKLAEEPIGFGSRTPLFPPPTRGVGVYKTPKPSGPSPQKGLSSLAKLQLALTPDEEKIPPPPRMGTLSPEKPTAAAASEAKAPKKFKLRTERRNTVSDSRNGQPPPVMSGQGRHRRQLSAQENIKPAENIPPISAGAAHRNHDIFERSHGGGDFSKANDGMAHGQFPRTPAAHPRHMQENSQQATRPDKVHQAHLPDGYGRQMPLDDRYAQFPEERSRVDHYAGPTSTAGQSGQPTHGQTRAPNPPRMARRLRHEDDIGPSRFPDMTECPIGCGMAHPKPFESPKDPYDPSRNPKLSSFARGYQPHHERGESSRAAERQGQYGGLQGGPPATPYHPNVVNIREERNANGYPGRIPGRIPGSPSKAHHAVPTPEVLAQQNEDIAEYLRRGDDDSRYRAAGPSKNVRYSQIEDERMLMEMFEQTLAQGTETKSKPEAERKRSIIQVLLGTGKTNRGSIRVSQRAKHRVRRKKSVRKPKASDGNHPPRAGDGALSVCGSVAGDSDDGVYDYDDEEKTVSEWEDESNEGSGSDYEGSGYESPITSPQSVPRIFRTPPSDEYDARLVRKSVPGRVA